MSVKLSIVFAYRNREVERVKRCLESLNRQSENNFNVIFIDYGSTLDTATEIKKIADLYPFCKYFYNDTRGMAWNRAHALNSGIRVAEGEYIMTSDIDLIYSKDFIKEVFLNIEPNVELHSNAYKLPKNFIKWGKLDAKANLKLPNRNLTALGMVQVVLKGTLNEIKGFDEYYRIWGAEDEDLTHRLRKKGLLIEWLDLKRTPVYHQWHPSSGIRARKNIPNGWQKNLGVYFKNNESIVRNNDHEWGKLVTSDLRKIFEHRSSGNISKRLKLNEMPVSQSIHTIYSSFKDLKNGESIEIVFEDVLLPKLKKSLLYRLIIQFNKISNEHNWPLLLNNDLSYFGNYNSAFDFRDMIMFFILNNDNEIEDYYINQNEEFFQITILKK